ncbi:MAG: fimbrial biogenesis outer membrane usher protein [Hyphomicrobium sp.]|nr:fimbrial biogenesis outer membrane usher protein [Hyphomicrobium sp.]
MCLAAHLALIVLALTSVTAAVAIEYAQEITSRLNPTGRTITITVPITDHGQSLGDVVVQITAEDAILVEATSLVSRITSILNEETLLALKAIEAAHGAYIPVAAFPASGIALSFDPGLQELAIALTPEQRPTGHLSVGHRNGQIVSGALTLPEFAAGYLNIFGGIDQYWDTAGPKGSIYEDQPSGRLELESAVRVGSVVVENRAAYDGETDITICPETAICTYGHAAGFKRQTSRLVYDIPEHEVRVMLGDTDPIAQPLQHSADILGLSIEKSGRKLNPGESIVSTGRNSFRLERSSSVEVIVNGASLQQMKLRPGNYTLRDFNLAAGANNVELVIVDEAGERRSLQFNSYSDPGLLAEGKSEWAIAGGLPSYLLDNERTYAADAFMASSFARVGLTDDVTAEADLQGDLDVVMGGAGVVLGTNWGVVGLHAAYSTGAPGDGTAFSFDWRLFNFDAIGSSRRESVSFLAEYRSPDFHTPGEFLATADGIVFPESTYWLRLDGSYSVPVYDEVMATLSLRYQFDEVDRARRSPYRIEGDRYGADVTISAPIGELASASMTVGYSNELLLHDLETATPIDPEFRVGVRLNVRPDEATSLASGYDTLGQQATLSAYRTDGAGVGRWDTSVDVQSRGYDNSASVSAGGTYYGNRAELRLSHYADADDVRISDGLEAFSRQRTSLRVGTAIAFAGDKVAFGAPVRGGAFAVVVPHESLDGHDVSAGNLDEPRAVADQWGNGLIGDLPAYQPSSTAIDVTDLPLGYSLGSGSFDTFAPYKAGHIFSVGSANSVTVYGTLLTRDGSPLSLLAGSARIEGSEATTVALFTNGEGRFGAEGLAPGRWTVEMPTEEGMLVYTLDVPAGAEGLVKVGTLQPSEERAP